MGERRAVLLTLLAVAAAYATAFGASFQFDDLHAVVANPDVQSWRAWAASMPGIRAATKASYVASHALSGAPWSFVLGGVLLHAAAAVLALLLLRRVLPSLGIEHERVAAAAWVAVLVFALHPAQTEAVTYAAARSVVLAAVFYLASLLAYERWRERDERGVPYASAGCFAVALAARETAWTLPFALLLLEAARGTPFRLGLRRVLPHAVVLAVALVAIALSPTYRRLLRESLATRGPLDNLFAQVEAIAYLVTHPLLTLRVNFDPDLRVPAAPDVSWWIAAGALAATIALGVACVRRVPWFGVGLLWFVLHLVPTNGAIARYDLVNDRQLYLALLGPAMIVGVVVSRITLSRGPALSAVVLAVVLATATILRNRDYRSELALWQATVQASPQKSRAWNNLGWALLQHGRRDEAREAFTRAVDLDPQNFRARANLESLAR